MFYILKKNFFWGTPLVNLHIQIDHIILAENLVMQGGPLAGPTFFFLQGP